jgi:hypothetical protein
VDIQPASSLDQHLIADSYAPASAGGEAVSAREAEVEPDPGSAPAGEPPASAEPALPGVYARNARPVTVRMAAPCISLLA